MNSITGVSGGQGGMNVNKTDAVTVQSLRKQYPHLQLSARSFSGEGAIKEYATNQSGKYNVAIDPRALSRMTEDPDFSDKIHGILAGVKDGDDWLEKETNKTVNGVTTTLMASGTVIDKDGNASGWSVVHASGTSQGNFSTGGNREELMKKITDAREKRAEEKKRLEEKREDQRAQESFEIDISVSVENNTVQPARNIDTRA